MEYIKTNSDRIRSSGIKISKVRIQETMSELMINKKTSWSTFWVLCIYYKYNAIVVYNQTYMNFTPIHQDNEMPTPTYLFTRSNDGHISIDFTALTKESLDEIKKTHIEIDHIQDRPIKAASSYKISDLVTMASILKLTPPSSDVKWKKSDWYDAILQKCLW